MFNAREYEEKEQRKLKARKMRVEERKKRFFDEKSRLFGVNNGFLEKQSEEKRIREDLEKARDEYFDMKMMENARIAEKNFQKLENLRKEKLRELSEFRSVHQKKENKREWDLNDPEQIQKDSLPSHFHFVGEDANKQDRVKAQQEQLLRFIEEKKEEDLRKKEEEDRAEMEYQEQKRAMNVLANEIDQKRNELRMEKLRRTMEMNQELSRMKNERDLSERQQDGKESNYSVDYMKNSRFLVEDYGDSVRNHEGTTRKGKFIPYAFKGFNRNEINSILEEREQQIREKEERKRREREEELAHQKERERNDKLALLYARELERKKKEKQQKLYEFQKSQAEMAKRKKEFFDQVYEGEVNEDFFNQFNTDPR